MNCQEVIAMIDQIYDTIYPISLAHTTIDGLLNGFIELILERDNLDQDLIKMLQTHYLKQGSTIVVDSHPLDAAIFAANLMRENSHGACLAEKIFISQNLYNEIDRDIGKKRVYTIRKVILKACEFLSENTIIVIGKPKFNLVDPSKLVLLAKIERVAKNA